MKPKNGFGKVLAVALLFALVFVAGVITGRYVVSSPGLVKSETVSEFGGVEGASYIIFKEGSIYYARNGKTGAIDYSGTDASKVIQNAIDASSSGRMGGIIYLQKASYDIQNTINLLGRTRLLGEVSTSKNPYGTILIANADPVIQFATQPAETRVDNVEISNLAIIDTDASKDNTGINMTLGRFGKIESVYLEELEYGIYISQGGFYNEISNIHIKNCATGILVTNEIGNANSNTIRGGEIELTTVGINFTGGTMNIVDNVGFESNAIGLEVNGGTHHRLLNSRLELNTIAVKLTGPPLHSFVMTHNYLTGNTFNINATTFGANSYVQFNTGYITVNYGNASSVANNDWVAHGLVAEPTYVLLTPNSNVVIWHNASNATHIQIGVASGMVDLDFYVIYQP